MKKLLLTFILLFSTTQALAAEITDTCRADIDRTNYTAITSTIQEVVLNIGDALHKKIINKDYDYQISYFGKVIELLDNIENNIGTLTPSKKQILGLLKQQVECKVGYIDNLVLASTSIEQIGVDTIALSNKSSFTPPTDYANILDYGAVGDGVTDNRAAITAALKSNPNVYIPDGVFIVSDYLVLLDTTKVLFGSGTIKLSNDKSSPLFYAPFKGDINGLMINGLTFYGAISALSSNIQDLTIQNCIFEGRDSIVSNALGGSVNEGNLMKNITIQNNTFHNITRFVIEFLHRVNGTGTGGEYLQNFTIKNNTFTRDSDAFRDEYTNTVISFSGDAYNTIIENNFFDGYNVALELSRDTVVRNNTIVNTNWAFAAGHHWKNMLISENDVSAIKGIGFGVSTKPDDGSTNVIIEKNNLHGSVSLTDFDAVIFRYNNVYYNTDVRNTFTIKNSSNVKIYNNHFENNEDFVLSIFGTYGIEVDSSTEIYDNTYYTPNATPYAVVLIKDESSPTVGNNDFSSSIIEY